jgi:hypothetical protein
LPTTPHYGLTPERYAEIDDELRRAAAYFAPRGHPLRDEIRDKEPDTNKDGITVTLTNATVEKIAPRGLPLRAELKRSQEGREIGRKIQKRLYGPTPSGGE